MFKAKIASCVFDENIIVSDPKAELKQIAGMSNSSKKLLSDTSADDNDYIIINPETEYSKKVIRRKA